MSRYDVVFDAAGCYIEQHFCREWDIDGKGCYGTNPDHGYTFEEAKQEVIKFWQGLKEEDWYGEAIRTT